MTAIFGLLNWSGELRDQDVEAMEASLSRYGRDCSELEYEHQLAMGACRAFMLPEDCQLPPTAKDDRYVVQVDARLTRRGYLLADLSFSESEEISDAEIVRAAVQRWGPDAFERLSGEFAIAAWDRRERRLLLARDIVGARPLFFHEGSDVIAFASMPAGLHALNQIEQKADRATYRRFLGLMNPAFGRTFFENIARVMPGHYALCDEEGVRQIRFWSPDLSPLELARQEDYENALTDLLDASVGDALRGTGSNVAAELSSGYDSTAVTTSAAMHLRSTGGKVTAFTAAPRAADTPELPSHLCADESVLAARIAAFHPNIEHVVIRRDRHVFANVERSASIYAAPYLNLCNATWCDAINDAVRERGFRVLLIGSMGNSTISESGTLALSELLRQGRLIRWACIGRGLVARGTMRWRGVFWNSVGPLLPDWLHRHVSRIAEKADIPTEDFLLLDSREIRECEREILAENAGLHPINRQDLPGRHWGVKSSVQGRLQGIAGDQGAFNKAIWAEWGIDSRDPTADRRLIEFALRIPVERLIWNGQSRAILTGVLKRRVPAGFLDPRRKGVQSADWAASICEAKTGIAENIERVNMSGRASELIPEGEMERLMSEWPANDSPAWQDGRTTARYRYALLRALSAVNHFNRANATNY